MINTDHYDIDNMQTTNRLLPWWLRGRKTILFLSAIFHPLISLHKMWRAWALERLIDIKTTSQPNSLEWYLDYHLRQHFQNKDDGFKIDSSYWELSNYVFYRPEWRRALELSTPIPLLESHKAYGMTIYNVEEDDPSKYLEDRHKVYMLAEDELDITTYNYDEESGSDDDIDTIYPTNAAFRLTVMKTDGVTIRQLKATKLITTNLSEVLPNAGDYETNEFDKETYDGQEFYSYFLDEPQLHANCIVIYAPTIVETEDYKFENYRFDILRMALKYITNQQTIYIIYNERISN